MLALTRSTAGRAVRISVTVMVSVTATVSAQEATDPIAQARQLYYSTYYEEALGAIAKVPIDRLSSGQVLVAREYRAMCLLALGRSREADTVIEAMLRTDPLYRPAIRSAPPMLQSAFIRVFTRVMPSLAREQFKRANAAFDSKRFGEAAAGFDAVARFVKAADAATFDQRDAATLKEIESLAVRLAAASRAAQNPKNAPPRTVFTVDDPGVLPPTPIRQEIPPWQGKLEATRFEGQLEIVIGVDGAVRSATITAPIHPAYDQTLLDAARKWRYRPASKEGRPVAYAETVTIRLAAPQQKE
jgi:TonB-like protein